MIAVPMHVLKDFDPECFRGRYRIAVAAATAATAIDNSDSLSFHSIECLLQEF